MKFQFRTVLSAGFFGSFLLLSACGEKEFRFDPVTESCKNKEGVSGYNEGSEGECGHLVDADLSRQDFSGEDFRGFKGENLKLQDANFDEADLRAANISASSISFSTYRGAQLQNAMIRSSASKVRFLYDSFQGARLSPDTVFFPFHFETVVEAGARLTDVASYEVPRVSSGREIRTRLDPRMSETESQIIRHDLMSFGKYAIEARENGYFHQFFGGRSQQAVIDYIDESVGRIYRNQSGVRAAEGAIASNDSTRVLWDQPKKMIDYIEAISNSGWSSGVKGDVYNQLFYNEIDGEIPQALDVLGLGSTHMDAGYLSMSMRVPYRLSILVHEGRHSYCQLGKDYPQDFAVKYKTDRSAFNAESFGLLDEVIALKQKGLGHATYYAEMDVLKKRLTAARAQQEALDTNFHERMRKEPLCGHVHVACPDDFEIKELRRKDACENIQWGAYFVQGIYSNELAHNCTNCREIDRQTALATAVDSFYRILNLKKIISGSSLQLNSLEIPSAPRRDSI